MIKNDTTVTKNYQIYNLRLDFELAFVRFPEKRPRPVDALQVYYY